MKKQEKTFKVNECRAVMSTYAWYLLTQNPKPALAEHLKNEIIRVGTKLREIAPEIKLPEVK